MNSQNKTSGHKISGQTDNAQLEQAFQLFNQFSAELTDSYADLESHVTELTKELFHARSERIVQLAEKESLAARLEGLLDALPAGIIVLDTNERIMQTNPIACIMLEISEETLIGSPWNDIAQRSLIHVGDEVQLKDERWVHVSVRSLNHTNKEKSGKLILLSDITETRLLQNKLNHQQRLSSLGEMIAGLAHQIRTPLSSALLYVTTINHPLNDENERIEFAEKAKDKLFHLERMVSDMLQFAKGDVVKSEYINTNEFMIDFKSSFESDKRIENGEVNIHKNLKNVIIKANHDVILSALQNIVDNALDALIESAFDKKLRIHIDAYLSDNNEFVVKIIDNGCGMTNDVKEKIIQPFFTTKSTGTGLGLAVVNATIHRYGGLLQIQSKEGVGSCFRLLFPRAEVSGLLPSSIVSRNKKINVNERLSTVTSITVNKKDTREVLI